MVELSGPSGDISAEGGSELVGLTVLTQLISSRSVAPSPSSSWSSWSQTPSASVSTQVSSKPSLSLSVSSQSGSPS